MLGAGEEVHQQQASINQQEAALQKLVDLQAADEIVTTRYVPLDHSLQGLLRATDLQIVWYASDMFRCYVRATADKIWYTWGE